MWVLWMKLCTLWLENAVDFQTTCDFQVIFQRQPKANMLVRCRVSSACALQAGEAVSDSQSHCWTLLSSPTILSSLSRDLFFPSSLPTALRKDLNPFLWLNSAPSPHLAYCYVSTRCFWRCPKSQTNGGIIQDTEMEGSSIYWTSNIKCPRVVI